MMDSETPAVKVGLPSPDWYVLVNNATVPVESPSSFLSSHPDAVVKVV